MDLRHLNTFLTLSKVRNYTQTAKQLHYAQSNISSQIQQLEQELNVKLFEQIGKKIYLTGAGEQLVPYAARVLSLASDITELYKEDADRSITIGATESLSIYVLPPILKLFKEQYPNVDVYLKVLDIPDFVPMIKNNTIDIAFVLNRKNIEPYIVSRGERHEELGLFALPEHPLAEYEEIQPDDLSGMPMLLTTRSCCYRKVFEQALSEASVELKTNAILETGSVPVLKKSTLSGLGMCFLPECTVEEELKNGQLVRLPFEIESPIYSQILVHRDKRMSEAMEDFISLVKNTICPEVYR